MSSHRFSNVVQCMRYLRFNRRIAFLADTLDYAGVSIKEFAVVFLLIFCAFNLSLYCILWCRLERSDPVCLSQHSVYRRLFQLQIASSNLRNNNSRNAWEIRRRRHISDQPTRCVSWGALAGKSLQLITAFQPPSSSCFSCTPGHCFSSTSSS